MREVRIPWQDGSVSGRLADGSDTRSPGVLLAHGAGTNQDHRHIVALRDGIAAAGFPVLTFNYPYTEAGRRGPDSINRLMQCHRAAAQWFRESVDPNMILAGRSMGGRVGSMIASEGEPCVGLILYGYPLHPAGKPDRLRKDHLASIEVPVLSFHGTRDALARGDLYDRWVRTLPLFATIDVDQADHSFRVPKRTGRTEADIFACLIERSVTWLSARM